MLYLAAAILAGVGATHHVGEQSPAFVATGDVRWRAVQAEAWLDGY